MSLGRIFQEIIECTRVIYNVNVNVNVKKEETKQSKEGVKMGAN